MFHTEKVKRLIEEGIIVCPKTKEHLRFIGDNGGLKLLSHPSELKYQWHEGSVPILLIDDQVNYAEYASASDKMSQEYSPESVNRTRPWTERALSSLSSDYRSPSVYQAFESIFNDLREDAVCIAVGGGPVRAHPDLLNVNIAPFPNVDIVADAHILPLIPESVDAIHCEAVLEHLYDPNRAVSEMYKVLRPGGKVYACTPFMQSYHGYPHHYQNFTLTGHQRLFESQGFKIEEAGVAVGPTYALLSINGAFAYEYFPKPFDWIFGKSLGLLARIVRPLDIVLNKRSNAHVIASTTYLLAVKS